MKLASHYNKIEALIEQLEAMDDDILKQKQTLVDKTIKCDKNMTSRQDNKYLTLGRVHYNVDKAIYHLNCALSCIYTYID